LSFHREIIGRSASGVSGDAGSRRATGPVRLDGDSHRSYLAALAFIFFIAHMATTGARSFLEYEALKDGNIATGVCFIFVTGVIMYATRAGAAHAAKPAELSRDYDRPRHRAERRGTMIAMLFTGRLLKRIDARVAGVGLPVPGVRALADEPLHDRAVRIGHRVAWLSALTFSKARKAASDTVVHAAMD
jgi:hypothetical protein